MSAWDVTWSEPVSTNQSVVGCELTRRGGLAYGVEIELSTTDSEARKMLWHAQGPQRPLADNGTRGFEATLPGANLEAVADGPVKFAAPRHSEDSALVVTVFWSDTAEGPRRQQAFTYRPDATSH
jgi:hypothetical protein